MQIQFQAFSIYLFIRTHANVAQNYILGDQEWCAPCVFVNHWRQAQSRCSICNQPLCDACERNVGGSDLLVCPSCDDMTEQDADLDVRPCKECLKVAYTRKGGCLNVKCRLYYMADPTWRPKKKGNSEEDWNPEAFATYAAKAGHANARTRNKGRKRKIWWAQRCAHKYRGGSSSAHEEPAQEWQDDWPVDVDSSEDDQEAEDYNWPTDDPMNQAPRTPPAAHQQPPPAAHEAPQPTVEQQDC